MQGRVSKLRADASERASQQKPPRMLTSADDEQVYKQAVRELDDMLTFDPAELPPGVDLERAERARTNARALQALMGNFEMANTSE